MFDLSLGITIDPTVRFGKPVIKGTRVPVETVVARVASGMSIKDVAEEYGITEKDIYNALHYAASNWFQIYNLRENSPKFILHISSFTLMTNRPLKVFLCHSSADKSAVRELYQKLRTEQWIQPWLDEEELYPGQDWNMEIEKAIEIKEGKN